MRGKLRVLSEEKSNCPICRGNLRKFGTRDRMVIKGCGTKVTLIIRRLRCAECGTVHHELPDMLVPYKRHCAETIENIIDDETGTPCCEESTIQRIKAWWAACLLCFRSVLASLTEKYGVVFSSHPTLKEIVRAVANAHLWTHTRSAFLSA